MVWISTDPKLFFGKNDPKDPRLGECVLRDTNKTPTVAIWGYPDDDGIRLNGGRWGAAEAPDAIRKFFYKLTPPLNKKKNPSLLDLGNLQAPHLTLEDRHLEGSKRAFHFTEKGVRWISLGGGHDYGYADGSGFLKATVGQKQKPVVVNFDAHLDVRPSDKGFHSGTPFFRLLEEFEGQFEFVEIGIQNHCNSKEHLAWVEKKGGHILTAERIQEKGMKPLLSSLFKKWQDRPLWISLDIDAIKSSEAPGCSQSWPNGLDFKTVLKTISWLNHQCDLRALSIYEVSPTLDIADVTSKAAAVAMHQFLSHVMESGS